MKNFPKLKPVNNAIQYIEVLGLIIIAIATTIAGIIEVMSMFERMEVALADLLLLFLYLEVLAMAAIYLETGKLPIRFPLYIAIIALARYLIIDLKEIDSWRMVAVAATIFIIGITVLIIRYGHLKLPYRKSDKFDEDLNNKTDLK